MFNLTETEIDRQTDGQGGRETRQRSWLKPSDMRIYNYEKDGQLGHLLLVPANSISELNRYLLSLVGRAVFNIYASWEAATC